MPILSSRVIRFQRAGPGNISFICRQRYGSEYHYFDYWSYYDLSTLLVLRGNFYIAFFGVNNKIEVTTPSNEKIMELASFQHNFILNDEADIIAAVSKIEDLLIFA